MTISLIIQMTVNWLLLDVYEKDSKKNVFFILIYSIPTILSLPFYCIFSSVLKKDEKKNINRNAMKIAGFIIYNETTSPENTCCKSCGFCCKKCFKQLNYGCCCYLCSFSYIFKCIFCCKCNCDDYNFYKIEKESNPEFINKKENICIIYKVNSCCFWFFDKILNIHVISFVPILYLFEAYNIGFKLNISEEKENKKKTLFTNIISLVSIFIYFEINKWGGFFMNKYLDCFSAFESENDNQNNNNKKKSYKSDFKNIIAGIYPLFISSTVCTVIISSLIYFGKINNSMKQYFIPISKGSSEYLKVVCLNYLSLYWKVNNNEIEILSSSFIFSFYLIIWNGISFILEILIGNLILFQFILALIPCCFLLLAHIIGFIYNKCS